MKNTIFLNIGLNVGSTEPKNQLQKSINTILNITNDALFSIVSNSEYNDGKKTIIERTLIVEMSYDTYLAFIDEIQNLPNVLNQDSIAMYIPFPAIGNIFFNKDYTGERYKFDIKYFRFPSKF